MNIAPSGDDDAWAAYSALLLSKTYPAPSGQMRILPIVPIVGGFAVNTSLYAAALWLLFAVPSAMRRRRRRRRGLCVSCAYPIGTSDICTECGGPVGPIHTRAPIQ